MHEDSEMIPMAEVAVAIGRIYRLFRGKTLAATMIVYTFKAF
jgi:hypothetical protein